MYNAPWKFTPIVSKAIVKFSLHSAKQIPTKHMAGNACARKIGYQIVDLYHQTTDTHILLVVIYQISILGYLPTKVAIFRTHVLVKHFFSYSLSKTNRS